MSDTDPHVPVLNGNDPAPAPGAAAVFQGMLGALGEELERLHRRMAQVQQDVSSWRAESRREAGATAEAVAEQVERAVARRLGELAATMAAQAPGADVVRRLDQVERSVVEARPEPARVVTESLASAIEDVDHRVARLEQALTRLVEQADVRSTTLASELQGALAAGMERLATVAARSEETTVSELQAMRGRVEGIATALADVGADVAGVTELSRRLADEGRARPVLEAIDAASKENGEVLAALHASVTRRIDARVRAVGEMVERLAGPLGAAAGVGPGVEEVTRVVAAQQATLETIRATTEEISGAVDASIGQSLEAVRSYLGEGLMHVSRRQAGTGRAMEAAAASLQSMERQLNELAALCQSLASGLEQQTAASARVADVVLETRSALRSDVDRLEATVHLEALKLHQQDQARLAGAAAATTEVVEREASLLAQRVSAVAVAVESVRTLLHGHVEDAGHVGSAPLALVKDHLS